MPQNLRNIGSSIEQHLVDLVSGFGENPGETKCLSPLITMKIVCSSLFLASQLLNSSVQNAKCLCRFRDVFDAPCRFPSLFCADAGFGERKFDLVTEIDGHVPGHLGVLITSKSHLELKRMRSEGVIKQKIRPTQLAVQVATKTSGNRLLFLAFFCMLI